MKSFKRSVKKHCRELGLARSGDPWFGWPQVLTEAKKWKHWVPILDRVEWLYRALNDDGSRECLVRIFVHRLAGAEHAPLPDPMVGRTMADWKDLEMVEDGNGAGIDSGFRGLKLRAYEIPFGDDCIRLYTTSERPNTLFDVGQYTDDTIQARVKPGDVVIDGGGCWGDSALYFAGLSGPAGRVFSFEFLESNLRVFSKNLELNPGLADRIRILERPLWSDAKTFFTVKGDGPATRVSPVPEGSGEIPAGAIPGISIDAFVEENGLDRLDFIKMDIEGSEPQALAGSLNSIRRFRPHLALCVYHHPLDFVRLAESVAALQLGYRFTLRHFTDGEWETVLFATAR